MMFSDDHIDAALSQTCVSCGMPPGEECVHQVTGRPLIESGCPVHVRRLEP